MKLPEFVDKAPKKPNTVARLVVAVVVIGALVAGGVLLSGLSKGPDDRARAIAEAVAPDVLLVVSGQDDSGTAALRIRGEILRQLRGTGCQWIGGTVTMGATSEAAAGAADRFIAEQRLGAEEALGEGVKYAGMGYAVVPTLGAIRGVSYIAVVAAIFCPPKDAAPPAGGLGQ